MSEQNSQTLSLSLSLSLSHTHTHTQGEHLRLFPLSASGSPNISSDEHNFSDSGEVCNEHLYSLGRFLPTSSTTCRISDYGSPSTTNLTCPPHSSLKNVRHKATSGTGGSVTADRRRVAQATTTSNLLMESYERGSPLVSAEETPPPSGPSSPMPPPLAGAAAARGSGGRHKPLSPQRSSSTFSAPKSSLVSKRTLHIYTIRLMQHVCIGVPNESSLSRGNTCGDHVLPDKLL